jgi:hypothetical protein
MSSVLYCRLEDTVSINSSGAGGGFAPFSKVAESG